MQEQRRSGHTVSVLMVHLVWVTKYRSPVLRGEIQKRCREIIIQICDAEDVQILKGVVSKDHIHMHVDYPSKLSVSDFVKRVKGRTSRKLQSEFPSLKKRYWGRHFWAIGYGAWSTG
ncbi:MAG: IS200/IS605 family transposase, partial [Mariprofundaceae bacterium]|nr:IS200/IS605 family transposase [Mariprofundaceae bacterium]